MRFAEFTELNTLRCEIWHPGFPNEDWNLADWSNAMCGEAGEAANVVKKIRRWESTGKQGALDAPPAELLDQLADEIGDVYAYLDLLATKAGIDIEKAIVRKFNRVSIREGWPHLQFVVVKES